jgi:hypothetical protein
MPKPSGLLRPLTLLALDDQIVLQAVANQIAKIVFARRKAVEGKVAFSNCLSAQPASIFFLQDWKATYHAFRRRLERHLASGNNWIGHFDLAAFYETISHRALQKVVAPSGGSHEAWELIRGWLCKWTSVARGIPVDHGIPQGPIASDFLAEVFLLPLDEAMLRAGIPYIRYVDDIRVLARTEEDVRRAAIVLELECRRWSLIPQSSKFSVTYATSPAEALGSLPSVAESTGRDADELDLDDSTALAILRSAVGGRPLRVKDKARLRYVLYRSGPSHKILATALRLLPRHPEHIDAVAAYFGNYSRSRRIMNLVKEILRSGARYDYVEGELWLIAARMSTTPDFKELVPSAQRRGRSQNLSFPIRRGLAAFFLAARNAGTYAESRAVNRLRTQSPYIQSLLLPLLTTRDYVAGGIASEMLNGGEPISGIAIAGELVTRGIVPREIGVKASNLAPEVKNVFDGLGLTESRAPARFDQIGDLLRNKYGVPYWRGWRSLLGTEYLHALQLLLTAEHKFSSDRSGWLASQNSFNDALFRAFQAFLKAKRLVGAVDLRYPNGKLKSFGLLLDANAAFAAAFPNMAKSLRFCNDRRNGIPDSHPYEFKTGQKTKHLKVRERNDLKVALATVYSEIVAFTIANS